MTRAQTRYDKLVAVYEDLAAAISEVHDPLIVSFFSSWKSMRKAYEQALESGISKSQIASGMEQGLRELPMVFGGVDGDQRAQLLNSLHKAVVTNFPEFFKQDASLLASILKRSKIRNAREYYLVRHRIDELEGRAGNLDERELLYKLVDQFEL